MKHFQKPLMIDMFCGLGGWAEGGIAAGYDVVGFDIERHEYGDQRYPAQMVIQDVLTLDGAQFRDAALIVASPPCQEFSYMAMPWTRAKQIARALRGEDEFPEGYKGSRTLSELTALFDSCFRIQREASAAAERHIPMVVENVKGAQPWVGRARWNYGSFYLWGDVPALMPMTVRAGVKVPGLNWSSPDHTKHGCFRDSALKSAGKKFNPDRSAPIKNAGGSWFRVSHNKVPHTRGDACTPHMTNPAEHDGIKQPGVGGRRKNGKGDAWFQYGAAQRASGSSARKAASAMIAKIPFDLARHVAQVYLPVGDEPPAAAIR